MPDTPATAPTVLDLLADFGPVPTVEWEGAIARDLKGADYDKRLVWQTDEGIGVRPYYRSEHAPLREPLARAARGWETVLPGHEPALDVDAIPFHEAGATAIQELAFALGLAADRLAADQPVVTIGFAVGGNHFMEIAKLRAARLLLEQVSFAFARIARSGRVGGASSGETAFGHRAEIRLHARTATSNKTLFDPYVNLLRVTIEAMSAVIGGCDSLTVVPCRFDAHLAENVQHILREESRLDAVADPGAGSYCVEALTDAVAREAWSLFQRIEAAGGFAAYRASGALDTGLAASRAAKEKAVAARRRILVGTNHYPNVHERALDAAAELGDGWRLASVIETIRLRTERHTLAAGRTPRVLLLERGDLKMRKARSAFCLNFFGCAGFEVVASDALLEAELVVLCSSDAEYLALAREVCPAVAVPVIVAGNPKDQAEALRAAGVADFVHVLSNAVDTLTRWQDRLGMKD
jgi:methylmalonyl-CoA mutase